MRRLDLVSGSPQFDGDQTFVDSASALSVGSSPRSVGGVAGGKASVSEEQLPTKWDDMAFVRVKLMCSYGGKILPRPHDNQLRYVGGETRIVVVNRNISFAELMAKVLKLFGTSLAIKYQLPSEDLDALISVTSDEDLENMMEEYDRMQASNRQSKLRLFLFPKQIESQSSSLSDLLERNRNREHWFVDALNGIPILPTMRSETSSIISEVPDYLSGIDGLEEWSAASHPIASDHPIASAPHLAAEKPSVVNLNFLMQGAGEISSAPGSPLKRTSAAPSTSSAPPSITSMPSAIIDAALLRANLAKQVGQMQIEESAPETVNPPKAHLQSGQAQERGVVIPVGEDSPTQKTGSGSSKAQQSSEVVYSKSDEKLQQQYDEMTAKLGKVRPEKAVEASLPSSSQPILKAQGRSLPQAADSNQKKVPFQEASTVTTLIQEKPRVEKAGGELSYDQVQQQESPGRLVSKQEEVDRTAQGGEIRNPMKKVAMVGDRVQGAEMEATQRFSRQMDEASTGLAAVYDPRPAPVREELRFPSDISELHPQEQNFLASQLRPMHGGGGGRSWMEEKTIATTTYATQPPALHLPTTIVPAPVAPPPPNPSFPKTASPPPRPSPYPVAPPQPHVPFQLGNLPPAPPVYSSEGLPLRSGPPRPSPPSAPSTVGQQYLQRQASDPVVPSPRVTLAYADYLPAHAPPAVTGLPSRFRGALPVASNIPDKRGVAIRAIGQPFRPPPVATQQVEQLNYPAAAPQFAYDPTAVYAAYGQNAAPVNAPFAGGNPFMDDYRAYTDASAVRYQEVPAASSEPHVGSEGRPQGRLYV